MISLKSLWGLRRWTRHDLILCLGGVFYVLMGMFYAASKGSPNRDASLQALLRIAPMSFWGGVFVFSGVLALISSRWPPLVETWGYVVLTGISYLWGTAYLTGILFTKAPWSNLGGFLLFGLLGSIWWAVSGLRNPEHMGVVDGSARSG